MKRAIILATLALAIVTAGCGKDPGQLRLENRAFCNDKGPTWGSNIYFNKKLHGSQPYKKYAAGADLTAIGRENKMPEQAFNVLMQEIRVTSDDVADTLRSFRQGKDVCLDYYGLK
jgi:hypothetical protein